MLGNRNRTKDSNSSLKIFAIQKQQRKKFKCRNCERAFNQKSNLNTHMRIHTGEKPFCCFFEECRKQFTTSGNLKSHLSIHTGQKGFTCPFKDCGKRYYLAYRLKIHMRVHKNEKPYKCDKCDKQFNEKGNLRIHERIHTGERPYKCSYSNCEARFKTQGHLKDHLTRHYDQKPFKCEVCSTTFKRLVELNKHLSVHSQSNTTDVKISNEKEKIPHHLDTHLPECDQILNSRKSSINTIHGNTFNVVPYSPNKSNLTKFFNPPPPTNFGNILPNTFLQDNFLFNDDYSQNNKLYHLPSFQNRNNNEELVDLHSMPSANHFEPFSNNLFFSYGIN